MRRGHKRLLLFEIVLFVILYVNSFVSNILGENKDILLLICVLILFKIIFGFDKNRHRYVKDVIFDVLIFLILFFILFYILGIFIGFARINDYYNWYGLKTFIIPTVILIVLKEKLRYVMINKAEGSKLMIILTCLLFIFLDVSSTLSYNPLSNGYNVFIFVALYLLPAISKNVVCSYITYKVGYKPILLYLFVIELYAYLIPIIPNPDKYLTSIVKLILPALFGYKVYGFFKAEDGIEVDRSYNKKNYGAVIIPIVFIIIVVYFTCGYFHYYAVAIASGSMEPKIHKGDVVVIEKIDGKYDDLEVGQTIAYRYSNVVVVHRIINIVKEKDTYYFYTKGDNNSTEDNYVIYEDMIIGTIIFKVPYAGVATVWLNEL